MITGTLILPIVAASVVVVSVIVVFAFRFIARKLGVTELIEEGVILTETGVEFPRFMFAGKCSVNYEDIESVELVPFPESLTLRFRHSPAVVSAPSARWTFLKDVVVVKLKENHLFEYRLFTPRNPADFVRKLKSRIGDKPTSA